MGMSEFMHSRRWKTFMNYVYSIGAAIVLLGALFKLQHWPGGATMLTIGMSTEVLIFLLSGFEPISEPPDWAKVYPQLRENFIMMDDDDDLYEDKSASSNLSGLLDKAEISPELLDKVRKGLQDLSNTANGLSDISGATLATDVYVRNLSSASESMNIFAEINNRANQNIDHSLNTLVKSYAETSDLISKSSKEVAETITNTSKSLNDQLAASSEKLAGSYQDFSDTISQDFNSLNQHSKSYSKELERINGNLSALNASYEVHLESAQKQANASTQMQEDFSRINTMISGTIKEASEYQKQAELLNKNIQALNGVYGNMLGAMNIKG